MRKLSVLLLLIVPGAMPLQAQMPAGTSYDSALVAGAQLRMIGPTRAGRVTAVAGHRSRPNRFYMGATGGGVWVTDDAGHSWRNISDGYFATPSIGAIRVAPSSPDIVYVGTGSDGLRSNVITGKGVYRSDDGGNSWRFIGLRDAGLIGAVEVHPTDPNIVFVAAIGRPFGKNEERGVFKSADGGTSWRKVLFVSDSTGASDLEFHPTNPQILYAGFWRAERKPWTIISGAMREGGIWKSTDGGETWRRVEKGLPQGLIGKTDLAVSPADPRRVYALVEAPDSIEGLYRSNDEGETWELISTQRGLMDRPFYYTNVDADPTNADVVYVSATQFWKSVDGGRTFARRPVPHIDVHDLWINPDNPKVMVQGNDGGATVTLDGGENWSTQLNQPTAELYQVATDNRFPYWVYAGQQDNSTIAVPSLPPSQWTPDHPAAWWEQIGGCETGPAVPKPDDWRIVYSNCKGIFGRYSHETGQEQMYPVGVQNIYGHNPRDLKYRFQRVVPIHVSPHDPNTVYHASQFLHRTRDGGRTWEVISPDLTAFRPEHQVVPGTPITRDVTGEEYFSTIYAVEESPLARGTIWVGTNDGLVQLSRDDGKTWSNVTPADLPPNARIQTVEASPHDPAEAYIAAYRFLLDDWQPYIFRTTDHGRSWTRLTTGQNGIPADEPTRVIREDPVRPGLLYVGTEWGLYVSFDEGLAWQRLGKGLPVVPVTDITIADQDIVISTMGRSFWVLDEIAWLRQLAPETAAQPARLFEPDPAYRMRYSTGFVPPMRGTPPRGPEYPRPGVWIDYWIGAEPAGPVTLEVLDAAGTVVRSFSSEARGERIGWSQALRGPVPVRYGSPRLETGRGLHRFRWDMSLAGPWGPGQPGGRGPLVTPGRYTLRFTAGDVVQIAPLEIRIDPRVLADGTTDADLEAQLALTLQVRDLVSRVRALQTRVNEEVKRRPRDRRLREASARLSTVTTGSYPQPMLVAQVEYLYGMINQADQRPGQDAYARYDELRREVEAVAAMLR